ncbi:MAG: hypothetical protein ACYDA8_20960 [Deferrisomatales bacterium]
MSSSPAPADPAAESPATRAWQRRLLPLMAGSIVAMGVFFFAASLYQLYYLHGAVRSPGFDVARVIGEFEAGAEPDRWRGDPEHLLWKTLVLLEHDLVQRRYHQVNAAMLARVWTRYLGFVTGMILALVGAAFILGKIREAPSEIKAEGGGFQASVASASPGILLAFLGTVLIAITLWVPFEVQTRDVPVYLSPATAAAPPAALPAPLPFPEPPALPGSAAAPEPGAGARAVGK